MYFFTEKVRLSEGYKLEVKALNDVIAVNNYIK